MLTTDRERRTCAKYSAYDEMGKVSCYKCPLHNGRPESWDFRCKANSHYDRTEREWVYDRPMEAH